MSHEAFDVYRPSNKDRGKLIWIDKVFASGYDVDEMTRSLINHDGYPSDIVVRKARK